MVTRSLDRTIVAKNWIALKKFRKDENQKSNQVSLESEPENQGLKYLCLSCNKLNVLINKQDLMME